MTTTPGFPLLHLPHVVFDIVYRYYNISERILLSQCSKHVQSIIRSKESSTKYLDVSIERDSALVTLHFLVTVHRLSWSLVLSENGVSRIGAVKYEPMEAVQTAFNVCFRKLDITLGEHVESFDKLLVANDTLHRAAKTAISYSALTKSQLLFVLDHFEVKQLDMRGSRRFCPLEHYGYISIVGVEWVDLETLMWMAERCPRIEFITPQSITNQELNTFIKSWLAGDLKVLKHLEISKMNRLENENLKFHIDKVLEGIPTLPGAKKRKNAEEWFQRFLPHQNGTDIRRADGVLATVLVPGEWGAMFTVWKDSNPNDLVHDDN